MYKLILIEIRKKEEGRRKREEGGRKREEGKNIEKEIQMINIAV
ncbi:hypothetical protein [Okeania sp. SIO2B3]|nr:hypothetical protein [Okeania sp. SIO2B3]